MRYGWNRDTLKTICYQSYTNYTKIMGIYSQLTEEYENESNIANIKIKYLEDILNSIDVAVEDDYPNILDYCWVAEDEPIVSDIGTYDHQYYYDKLMDEYYGTVDMLRYKKVNKNTELYRRYELMEHTMELHEYNVPPKFITVIRDSRVTGKYTIIKRDVV